MSTPLRQALNAEASALTQRVLDRMYENPWWMERYGERGRRFANEDSLHHVQYLDQALASGEGNVFVRYAFWLRSVLVSRGMCSEHLAENFRLMAEELTARPLAGTTAGAAAEAIDILRRGADALRYTEGAAATLDRHHARLLQAIEGTPGGAAMREDDRRHLVSYLIDAAATGNAQFFTEFAARFDPAAAAALTAAGAALGVTLPAKASASPPTGPR
jgi:hypothetical protein